jgi:hypothetical protein
MAANSQITPNGDYQFVKRIYVIGIIGYAPAGGIH